MFLLVFPLLAEPPAQDPGAEEMLWTETVGHRLPSELTRSQVREDIALLRYALEHAYGGRRFVPAGDYAETRAELARLSDSAPLDPQALCDAIADALWKLPDNHLSISARDRSCGQARKQHRTPGVGTNVAAGSAGSKPWSLTAVEAGGQRIPVLSITSFPPPEDDAWAGYSEAVQGLLSSPAIIVDLRGNWGGADARGIELARVLLGRDPPYFFDAVVQRQTPGSIALLLNSARLERYVLGLRGEAVPGYLEETIGTLEETYREAREGRLPAENVWDAAAKPEADAPPAYDRPVVVLMDAACYSSCEGTVLYLKTHPRVVTVGENTGGYLHFGDVGGLVLPNSRLYLGIPTKYFQITGRYYERRGIEPDVPVPPENDALGTALDWLSRYRAR